jgi:GNAT superfamily N-acetyltransferase
MIAMQGMKAERSASVKAETSSTQAGNVKPEAQATEQSKQSAIESVKADTELSKADKLNTIKALNNGDISPEDVADVVGKAAPIEADDAAQSEQSQERQLDAKEPEAQYDAYDTLETRPETKPEQLEAGRSSLADVERRIFGVNRSSLRGSAAILGSNIPSDFREKGYTSLVGQNVESSHDLAMISQVLRDPRFETFRVFFVKDNKIVGERAYTSRLAASVSIPRDLHEHISADMGRTGANGYWLLHNHPAGFAKASSSDINLTEMLATNASGMLGHVIIDHNEYNSITIKSGLYGPEAKQEIIKADLGAMSVSPEVPHPTLGATITKPADFAAIARQLQRDGVYSSIIGTGGEAGAVTMILDVPDMASRKGVDKLRAGAAIRRAARETHSGRLFAVVPGELSQYAHLMDAGLFTDIISQSTGQSAAELGMLGRASHGTAAERRGMLAYVAEPTSPDYRQTIESKETDQGTALYSFAGQNAQTADKMALSAAQDRLNAGENAETVRKETGWSKGADGKWRFEIDDSGAKLHKPWPSKGQLFGDILNDMRKRRFAETGSLSFTVGDVLDHPALFAAYPELANISLTDQKESGASYSPKGSDPATIRISKDTAMSDVVSKILHEVQHVIQRGEGFATGGTVESARKIKAEILKSDLAKINDEIISNGEKRGKLNGRAWDENVARHLELVSKRDALDEEYQILKTDMAPAARAYQRLAGEVEARNTQSRQRMTADERRTVSPESTADVRAEDVIVVFNGKEMNNAPIPANAIQADERRTPPPDAHSVASAQSALLSAHSGKIHGALKAMFDAGKASSITAAQAANIVGEDALYSREEYFKRADQIERALQSMGLRVDREKSNVSVSTYIYAYAPEGSQFKENEGEYLKIRISNHKLPDSYVEPDFEVMVGGGHDGSLMNDYGTWDESVEFVARKFDMDVPPVIKRLDSKAKSDAKKATKKARDYEINELIRKIEVAKKGAYSKSGSGIWWLNKDSGKLSEMAQIGKMPEMNSEQVKVEYISRLEKQLAEKQGGLNQDIRYANDGRALAFFNPADGITYFIADHLPKSASAKGLRGLVAHEIGVHALHLGRDSKEWQSILKQVELMNRAGNAKVKAAWAQVPEGTPAAHVVEETLAYLVQNNPDMPIVRRVIAWLRNALRNLGKSLPVLQRGKFMAWANSLTEDDLVFMAQDAMANWRPESQVESAGNAAALMSVGGYNVEQQLLDDLGAIHPDVDAWVNISGDTIKLDELQMPKAIRGQGIGSRFMDILTAYADKNGMTIALTAAGDFGGSRAGQERFYRRFGFVPNKGRSKDYAISENMIRRPDKNAAAQFSRSQGNAQPVNPRGGKIIGDSGNYDEAQRAALERTGSVITKKTIADTLHKLKQDAWKKMAQGLADQFRPIRDLDQHAYNLLRLSKGATGAFEAFMHYGKLSLNDGATDADQSGGVLEKVFFPLGKESTDFLRWIAGNRAERLMGEGKERLFNKDDIAAFKSLADRKGDFANDYTLIDGTVTRDRKAIYKDSLVKFNEFNKNVLDIAEQSGLIDGDSRKLWEHEFYVPFYRVAEENEGEARGMYIKSGVIRQEAFKKLKGGEEQLNDLMANTLGNWAHLIDASAKNRAATATLEAAEKMGVARKAVAGDTKTVWVMGTVEKKIAKGTEYEENGVTKVSDGTTVITYHGKVEYKIDDPYIVEAVSSLEFSGIRGPMMDILSKPKHWLTIGVTASPFFKIRNLIRDSVQAIATSDLNYNPASNVIEGWKLTNRKKPSQQYVSALAGGGLIRFGTMLEGNEASRVRQLIKQGAKDEHILDDEGKIRVFYDKYVEPSITMYNELGNRGEEVNRMSLYHQLREKGMGHAEASVMSRDLMDFSMQGSWKTVRFLTQLVPFLNARIQGMYKLGRASTEDKARFAVVLGAVTMVSLALLAMYGDDDDWKKREDWDRDNYWWFKLGGVAFRVPKPFEIGAIATLAERTAELAFDKEMTGQRFADTTTSLIANQLAMNPVPQTFKPMIDLYANQDSFSKRPIESMGMERLEPGMRFTQNTSMLARGISSAGNALTGDNFLSPVQLDFLNKAYFGWLGATAVSSADMMVRGISNEPTRPAVDHWKFASGGMVAELSSAQSRYVSMMYDQAAELEQAYATYNRLRKDGKIEDAKEYREEHKDELSKYHKVENVKRSISKINERIRLIEKGALTADEKRALVIPLREKQSELAKRLYQ